MEDIEQFISLKALIFYQGKVLLLREGDYAANTSRGNWQFPGGRLDRGENFQDGLKREVREETGLEIELGQPIYMTEWFAEPQGRPWQIVAVFLVCEAETDQVVISEEHDAYQWILPEEVLEIPNVSIGIKEAMQEYLNFKIS